MVATPSKKKSKLTYADRVVRALSEHQRAHKKRAIHLATLRAQIRKDADADNDHLGPQWSHWISRAVNKLTEQRVLMPAGPNHYAFTEESKKALTTARRETITAAPGTPKRHAQEEHVWRSVSHAQPSPSRGTKRPRRSSVVNSHHQADEDFDFSSPMKSISRRAPNKKARRSSIKGVSRMTKAELLELLQDVEDEGNEEAARLRTELNALHAQLSQAAHGQGNHPEDHDPNLLPLSRPLTPLTPLPAIHSLPPSPTTDRPTALPEISSHRPILAVTRTESGSLIHHFSKQPTPAPSNPDEDEDMDQNPFECPPNERAPHGRSRTDGLGLATPSLTPFIEKSNLPANGDEPYHSASTFPAAKVSALHALHDTHDKVVRECLKLKDIVASRDARIATLQSELNNKTGVLAAQQADLSVALARASELEGAVLVLQKSVDDKSSALAAAEEAVEEGEASIAVLGKEKAAQATKLAEYERSLEDLKHRMETREAEHAKSEEQLRAASDDRIRLRKALENKDDEIRALDVRCKELQERYERTNEQLQSAQSEVLRVATHLTSTEAALAAESEQRTLTATRCNAVQRELADAEIIMTQLRGQMTLSKDRVAGLEAANEELARKLSRAEDEAAAHREGAATLASNLASLQQAIEASNSTADSLRDELHTVTVQAATLTSEVARQADTITVLTTAKEVAEAGAARLENELEQARAGLTRLQGTMDELQSVVSTRDAEVVRYRADLDAGERARATLEHELAGEVARAKAISEELEVKNAEFISLRATLDAAQNAMRTLSAELKLLKTDRAATEEQHRLEVASMTAELRASRAREDALRSDLDAVSSNQAALSAQTQQLRSQLDANCMALERERVRASALEEDLSSAVEREEDLQRQTIQWRDVKREDDQTILALKSAFEKYHAMLRSQLAEAETISALRPAASPRT